MLRELLARQNITACLADYPTGDCNLLESLFDGQGKKKSLKKYVSHSNPSTPTGGTRCTHTRSASVSFRLPAETILIPASGGAMAAEPSPEEAVEGQPVLSADDLKFDIRAGAQPVEQRSAAGKMYSISLPSTPTSEIGCQTEDIIASFKSRSSLLKRSWRKSRSKSQGASSKNKWDRPERKENDTSSTASRVEMVPEGGGGAAQQSAQESASQAAQEILISSPGSSKARQKKFHRHFKTVPPDEKVLNYYSCALVADILLQGHLYITRNYFAFYSNVFGYVTKLLIPTTSVLKVTKEKTAYIIPNAVGVTTEDDKHVFGSLLSRDNTYKLMVQVWNAALAPTIPNAPKPEIIEERLKEVLEDPAVAQEDEESSLSGSESNLESKLISSSVEPSPKGNTQKMALEVKSYHDMFSQTAPPTAGTGGCTAQACSFLTFLRELPRPTLLLLISTGLLVLLFLSAAVLLYRIARLHQAPLDFSSRSMNEVHAYINSNLEHITKVRESLEKLSFLIENGGKYHR